jgi:hypothetical protein
MGTSHNLRPLRSHAGAGLRSRLADWFRRDDEPEMLPAPPMADLQHDDGLDVADAVKALLAQDEPGWDLAAPARMQPHPPWNTAEQEPVTAASWPGYKGETLTDSRTPDGRPFAPGLMFTPERMTPVTASTGADLDGLIGFRDAVRAVLVRRERAQGHRDADGGWWAQYTRTWDDWRAEIAAAYAAIPPPPDFGLPPVRQVVDEIVAGSGAKADEALMADRAARSAAAAASPGTCPEYAGRHSTGEGAAA